MHSNETISPQAAILVTLVTFLVSLFAGGVLFVVLELGLALIIGELLIAAVPLVYMLHKKVDVSRYIRLKITPKPVFIGMLIGLLLLLLNVTIAIGLAAVFGTSAAVEESNKQLVNLSSSMQGSLYLVVALSLAGFCEELTFRGFLLNSIANRHSFAWALLVSSLAFGLFHPDPQAVYTISAFLMGLVLGFVYYRWQSYTVSSVAHATMNLVALAFYLLPA